MEEARDRVVVEEEAMNVDRPRVLSLPWDRSAPRVEPVVEDFVPDTDCGLAIDEIGFIEQSKIDGECLSSLIL